MNKVLAEIRKSPGKSTTLGLFALVAACVVNTGVVECQKRPCGCPYGEHRSFRMR